MQTKYQLTFVLSIVLSAAFSFPAYGRAGPVRSAEYDKCIKKAEAVDPAILDCISAEYSRADKRLNNAYKKLMGTLKADRKKDLQEVQRL
ncbi:lysozyme inhibitor LprI family protein [Undibacterium sp. TC4M20W]|uniref:lysozyme inhibitor LprI family protein n=1 Tax=unclassified Undibacterium TaxID=2630295 RepID=UPI003BF21D5D